MNEGLRSRWITEAKAQLEWNYAPDRVVANLVELGASVTDANRIVEQVAVERSLARTFRAKLLGAGALFLIVVGLASIFVSKQVVRYVWGDRAGYCENTSPRDGVSPVEFVFAYNLCDLGFLLGVGCVLAGLVILSYAITRALSGSDRRAS